MIVAAGMMAVGAASAADDPFGPPPTAGSAGAVVRSLIFDRPGAVADARGWMDAHPRATAAEISAIGEATCRRLKIRSLYAEAAAACVTEAPATMTTVLRDAPPLRVHGPGRAALTWNFAGSLSAEVTVRGMTQPWIIDTGAQISTIPQSTATALGVRLMPGAIGVGTSTKPIQGQVGIIDRLRIGGATAENVPVLVLPDATLTIDLGKPGGPPRTHLIAGILGLPVLTAFRRVAFAGRVLQLGDAAPTPDASAPPIYWREDGVGVPVTLGGYVTGFLLDTGANLSDLGPPGAEDISPTEQAAALDKQVHVGGAGGVVIRRLRSWPTVSLWLAGARVQLHGVSLEPAQRGAGRLGMDAVRSLGFVVLDFEHMRMSVGGPTEETKWPAGA